MRSADRHPPAPLQGRLWRSTLVCQAVLLASIRAASAATTAAPATAPALELPAELRAVQVESRYGVVSCASPLAADAGARVLEAGGNAVDAAVAAAFALGASEPGASGLGGQTYLLICMNGGTCVAVDGSATVPLRISRTELARLADDGSFIGHKVVGTPATLAALAYALTRFGTMSLADVLAPAIDIADRGITFPPAQLAFLTGYRDRLRLSPELSQLLLRDGLDVWDSDHVYCLADLACTMRRIATAGQELFYSGAIADEIVADMKANGGWVSRDDLARIMPQEKAPLHGEYRGYEVVSFPSPGAGGAVIEALQILGAFPSERLQSTEAGTYALQMEATRLALADEEQVWRPVGGVGPARLDRRYALDRAKLIRTDRALTPEEIGGTGSAPWFDRDTTQLSVVDRFGNAVSVTQTLGRIFGAYVATPGLGFPYNGLLESFDLENPASRSYLKPMQSPLSSMAPTILRRNGKPVAVLGSVGSGRVTSGIVLAISNIVDRRLPLVEAVEAPRVLWGGNAENRVYVEIAGAVDDSVADALQAYGYDNMFRLTFPPDQGNLNVFGSVNSIVVRDDGTAVGVGDPRRNGGAVGAKAPAPRRLAPLFGECWRELRDR